jgi:hypothetical protein
LVGRVVQVGPDRLDRRTFATDITPAAGAVPVHRHDHLGAYRRLPTVDAVAELDAAVLGVKHEHLIIGTSFGEGSDLAPTAIVDPHVGLHTAAPRSDGISGSALHS